MDNVCVAFKAHLGWLNAVAVLMNRSQPQPVWVARLDLFEGAQRSTIEPFHVAGGWQGLERVPVPDNPLEVIQEGQRRQAVATLACLRSVVGGLKKDGYCFSQGVILSGRGRMYEDPLRMLASHAQIHIAEGESIREAARGALGQLNLPWVEQDERSIAVAAAQRLHVDDADAAIKGARPLQAARWRKEERLLGLAAWLAS